MSQISPPPLPVTPALDLRKLSVADLLVALTQGRGWAWRVMRQLVQTSAQVSRYAHGRRDTPPPMPALIMQLKNKELR